MNHNADSCKLSGRGYCCHRYENGLPPAKTKEIFEFNELGKAFKISYAHGCAFSSDYENCTLRTLFDKADKNMYNNKQAEKAGR